MKTAIKDDLLLSEIVDLINQVIIVTDNQNKFIYISPNTEKILGINHKEIEAKNYLQNFFPTLKINWQELLTYKKITNIEIQIEDQVEATLYLLVDIRIFNEKQNQIIYVIQNITKTKKIEQNLAFSEQMYANLVNNLPIGIFRLDNKGNCQFANSKACEILGWKNQETFREFWLKNIVYEEQERIFYELAETLTNSQSWQTEYQYQYSPKIIKYLFTQCVPEINTEEETNYVGIIMDFTDRKQAEKNFQNSYKNLADFKYALDEASIVAITNPKGIITYVNQKFCEISKYSEAELIGKTHKIVNSGYHFKEFFKDLWQTIISGKVWRGEVKNKAKDGTFYWVDTTIIPFLNNKGKPFQYLVIRNDITSKKQTEEKLKESEEKFKATFEQAAVGIAHVATDGSWLRVNQKLCDIVGYTREELLKLTFQDITYPDDLDIDLNYVNSCLKGEIDTYSMEKRYIKKQGNIVWINLTVSLLKDNFSKPKYFISVINDISENKQIELKLKESEERFRNANEELEKKVKERTLDLQKSQEFLQLIINNIPQYIFWKDRNSIYLGCNKNFAQTLGFKNPNEIIGKNDYDLPFLKEEADFFRKWDYWVMEHNQPRYHNIEIVTINDHKIWTDTCKIPLYNSTNNVVGILGTYEDITERKQLEENLKLTQFTLDKLGESVFFLQEDASFFYVNEAAYQRLGYTKEELLALKLINIDTLFFDFSAQDWRIFWQNLIENKVLIIESFYRHKNGKNFPVEISMFSLNFENKVYACIVARDITKRKKVEEELKDSEERYRLMATNSSDMISRHSPKGVYLYASPACRTLLGYNPNELVGKSAYNFIYPDDIPQIKISHQSILAKNIVNSDIYRIKHKNGQYIWFETTSKTVRAQNSGKIIEIIAISRDITARKETEFALQESEKRYRQIVETSAEGIWVLDANNNTSFVNEKMAEMLGYSTEEMMGQSLFSFMDDEGKKQAIINVQKRRQGIKEQHDFRFIRKDGSNLWCLISTTPIVDDNGHYEGALGMIVDITERIKAEQALRYSEERFRIALKNSPIVVFNQDANLRYTWIYNPDLGFKSQDIIGKFDQDIYLEKDAQKLTLLKRQVLSTKKGIRKEISIGNDQNIKHYDLTIDPLFDLNKNIEGVTCAALDITAYKQAEIKIKQSLEEKEVLLKEIHHRVKNNLYVISSLLNLQSSYFNDPKIITCFQESQNRIQSMAMIHEQLYRSENLASINFSDYINQLVNSLFSSYNSQINTIKPIVNIENICLKIEIAIPCGLLINELITNSFKHAFKIKKSGEIKLELYRASDQKIHLIVSDNGDGLPDGLDWKLSPSLGLRLVHILSQQIEATLDLQSSQTSGTSFYFVI